MAAGRLLRVMSLCFRNVGGVYPRFVDEVWAELCHGARARGQGVAWPAFFHIHPNK